MKMKTLAICNQKGGVGKSTITCHFGFRLLEDAKRSLLIELDTQRNVSKTLAPYVCETGAGALFSANPIDLPAKGELTVIAADGRLLDIEHQPPQVMGHFRSHLTSLRDRYDYCVIDCAPALGWKMSAALMSADFVLAPIEMAQWSLDGVKELLKTVFGIKQKYNEKLVFLGLLVNRLNAHDRLQKQNLVNLMRNFGQFALPVKVAQKQAIPEALLNHMPVWRLRKTAARDAAKDMRALLDLVLGKIGDTE